MWKSEQKVTTLVTYRSADRIQAEIDIRNKITTIKKILEEKQWKSIDNCVEQNIVTSLPEHVSENTKVEMQLTTIYLTQKHNTEYVIYGKLNYTVITDAFSKSHRSVRHFIKNIKNIQNSSKKETIARFLYTVKQEINRIQKKIEDPDEYLEL